ncbi:hypothetical protein [Chitinimonas sp.]|uniref:hypothetical protein n=1 Tax=Chitinimonas sp. TaxID=1934313 RepID=UPI002F9320C9
MDDNTHDRRRRIRPLMEKEDVPSLRLASGLSGAMAVSGAGGGSVAAVSAASGGAFMLSGGAMVPAEVDAFFHALYADRELQGDLVGDTRLASTVPWPTLSGAASGPLPAGDGSEADARQEAVRQLDEDYRQYRRQRYDESFDEFTAWRRRRDLAAYRRQLKARASGQED